jgi:hypothetical protein
VDVNRVFYSLSGSSSEVKRKKSRIKSKDLRIKNKKKMKWKGTDNTL